MSQRALIFHTQIGGPLEEESEDDLEVERQYHPPPLWEEGFTAAAVEAAAKNDCRRIHQWKRMRMTMALLL
jgi:hypothetical protein